MFFHQCTEKWGFSFDCAVIVGYYCLTVKWFYMSTLWRISPLLAWFTVKHDFSDTMFLRYQVLSTITYTHIFFSVAQSSEQVPFTSDHLWVTDSCGKGVTTLCQNSCMVFPVRSGFLSQGSEGKLTGCVRLNTATKVITIVVKDK
jgi:hypothetical protein